MSSPCFEFGVALRTGHDLLKSVKRRTRKARSLPVRRTTLFEIDRSNNLFSERDAKLLFHPDARKALLASLGPKSSSLQSVRCAAYPYEIVHDDGTTKGSTGDVVSFGRQSARAVPLGRQLPIYQRLRPEVVAAAGDSGGEEDKFGMVAASNGGQEMTAIEKAGTSVQRCAVAYAFTGVPCLQYIGTVRSASSSRYRSSEYRRQKAYLLHRSLY